MAKILILVVLAACSIGVESQSDAWTNVTRDVLIPYDLEAHPLQIRTDSEAGSKDKVRVQFYTSDGTWTTAIRLRFKNALEYQISSCTSDWTEFTTALPDEQDKVWTITKGDAALTILCNDVEVLNYLYTDGLHAGSSFKCEQHMGRDAEQMKFTTSDTASDAYREQPAVSTCNLPTITNGVVTPSDATVDYGASYEVTCTTGYTMSGASTLTCQDGDTFDQTPTCGVTICAAPTIPSGTVSPLDDSVNYGETYAVTCNAGYTVSGSATMTCSADGAFDQNPTCLESNVSESCWIQHEKTKYTGTILATVYSSLQHVLEVCDTVNCVAYSCHAEPKKKGCNIYSEISGESPKWTSHVQGPCEV